MQFLAMSVKDNELADCRCALRGKKVSHNMQLRTLNLCPRAVSLRIRECIDERNRGRVEPSLMMQVKV